MGDILGKKSDIADGSLRDWDFRKFEHLVGDYYVAPKFLDAMAVRFVYSMLPQLCSLDYICMFMTCHTSSTSVPACCCAQPWSQCSLYINSRASGLVKLYCPVLAR